MLETQTEVRKDRPLSWPEIDDKMKSVSPESRVAYLYLKSLYPPDHYDRRDHVKND